MAIIVFYFRCYYSVLLFLSLETITQTQVSSSTFRSDNIITSPGGKQTVQRLYVSTLLPICDEFKKKKIFKTLIDKYLPKKVHAHTETNPFFGRGNKAIAVWVSKVFFCLFVFPSAELCLYLSLTFPVRSFGRKESVVPVITVPLINR